MSYSIVYDRRILKVGDDQYILMVNSGSNNCWESYKRPEKVWSALKVNNGKTIILSEKDINNIADSFYNSEIAKARGNFFRKGELTKWLKAGIKNAFTLEEAVSWDNWYNVIKIYDYENQKITKYKTTAELLNAIRTLESNDKKFNIRFCGRDFVPKKKVASNNLKPLKNENCSYVLFNADNKGYLISVNTDNSYTYCKSSNSSQILKFKTLLEIDVFKENSVMNLDSFVIKQLEKKDVAYCLKDKYDNFFVKITSRGLKYSSYENDAKILKTRKEAEKYLEKINNSITFSQRGFEIKEIEKEFYFSA